MGDSLKEDYEYLCEYFKIKRRFLADMYYDMYSHSREIYNCLQVKNSYEFWAKIKELESKGWTIEYIKDFFRIC